MADLTKDEAREALVQMMAEALDDCGEISLNADELEEAANYAAEAAWSARPDVLAAAKGGEVVEEEMRLFGSDKRDRKVIVLPDEDDE